jgi:hypothetical protein
MADTVVTAEARPEYGMGGSPSSESAQNAPASGHPRPWPRVNTHTLITPNNGHHTRSARRAGREGAMSRSSASEARTGGRRACDCEACAPVLVALAGWGEAMEVRAGGPDPVAVATGPEISAVLPGCAAIAMS